MLRDKPKEIVCKRYSSNNRFNWILTGAVIYQKDQNCRKDPEIPERSKKYAIYTIILFFLSFMLFLSYYYFF